MSSQLAANHWNQQQAEQEERMRMKKLTLDINERQEQEDYQGKKITKYVVFVLGMCRKHYLWCLAAEVLNIDSQYLQETHSLVLVILFPPWSLYLKFL